jgi:hypothetical protein
MCSAELKRAICSSLIAQGYRQRFKVDLGFIGHLFGGGLQELPIALFRPAFVRGAIPSAAELQWRRTMQQDMEWFLNLKAPPARLTTQQAAWFLGFSVYEIPMLVSKGLLKPLGHPPHNGQKFFLAATLEELRRDEKWFGKASDAVVEYWRQKNGGRVKAQVSAALPLTTT